MARGFTILELSIALGLISIMTALGFAIVTSKKREARIRRAEADLQVIQLGLEAYRARFGDYPQVPETFTGSLSSLSGSNEYLLNALNGQIGPGHDVVSDTPSMLNNAVLNFSKAGLPLNGLQSNSIVDPWGQEYMYSSKPMEGSVELFGYMLKSAGPDGVFGSQDDIVAK